MRAAYDSAAVAASPASAQTAPRFAALGLAVILATYPFANACLVLQNLSLHDLALGVFFVALLVSASTSREITRLLRTGYGGLSLALVAYLWVSTLFSDDQFESASWAVQLTFVYLVLFPSVAFTMRALPEGEKVIYWGAVICVTAFVGGVVFVGLDAKDAVVEVKSSGRHRATFLAAHQVIVLVAAYALSALAMRRPQWLGAVIGLAAATAAVAATGSRRAVVGIGVALAVTAYCAIREGRGRKIIVVCAMGALAVALVLQERTYSAVAESLGVRLSDRIAVQLTEDDYRTDLASEALGSLSKVRTALIGEGLGTTFFLDGSRLHNAFLQVAVETGLAGGLIYTALVLAPCLAFRFAAGERARLGLALYVSQLTFLMFGGIRTERAGYVPVAVAVGLLYARFCPRPAPSARRWSSPPALGIPLRTLSHGARLQ